MSIISNEMDEGVLWISGISTLRMDGVVVTSNSARVGVLLNCTDPSPAILGDFDFDGHALGGSMVRKATICSSVHAEAAQPRHSLIDAM